MDNKLVRVALGATFASLVMLVVVIVIAIFGTDWTNSGVACVKSMYAFNSPKQLVANQQTVQRLLSEDEWERLQLDNELRAVNAYYKFGYDSSAVKIDWFTNDCVFYEIENSNVPKGLYWLFQYETDLEGKIDNVREFRVVMMKGSEGLVESGTGD